MLASPLPVDQNEQDLQLEGLKLFITDVRGL